jgi:hypothetical protein
MIIKYAITVKALLPYTLINRIFSCTPLKLNIQATVVLPEAIRNVQNIYGKFHSLLLNLPL